MVIVAGVDDAGRGPVIGPMVLAGVSIDEKDLSKLRKLGVKDSKLLSPMQREDMYDYIIEIVKSYEVLVISPAEIDAALEDKNTNLNWLESKGFAKLINWLDPDRVVVDCPSPNIKAYSEHLRKHLKVEVHVKCEHKADFNHAVVAAASILAKVSRDREVAKLREKYGDFGSGYPADPRTKEFLAENWDKCPEIFRRSWASYKKYSGGNKQAKLGDF
jgi:ribonuclease HII